MRTLIMALAVPLLAATTVRSCDTVPTPGSLGSSGSAAPVGCVVSADNPQGISSTDLIVGTVHVSCDRPDAQDVHVDVLIQRQDGNDSWETVATSSSVVTGSQADVASSVPQASLPCQSGTFRVLVRALTDIGGGSNSLSNASVSVTDPCGGQ